MIALIVGEDMTFGWYIIPELLLGFVAYGLSIFTYIRAQIVIPAFK